MNKNTFNNYLKENDFLVDCDDCGMTCWYHAQSRLLDSNTSKGGLRVCPNCVYAIDWGAIPYTIEPEEAAPDRRTYQQEGETFAPINMDFSTYDPLSGDLPE